MNDLAQISEVRLLGPTLPGDDGRSLWVAHFSARLDQNLIASGDFMRNASLRVLSEATNAREGYRARTDPRLDRSAVAFRDPRLFSLAVHPDPAWFSALFLDASADGRTSVAHSEAVAVPDPDGARDQYALATAAPLLTKGRWPDKKTGEIETPPLRLAEGALEAAISHHADGGLWRALGLGDPPLAGGLIPILWDGANATKLLIEPRGGNFDVADLPEPPPPIGARTPRPRPKKPGAPPRIVLRLTAKGIEFDAWLRLPPEQDIALRVQIEPNPTPGPGDARVRLALIEDKADCLRGLVDRLAAAVPAGLAFNVRPGRLSATWRIGYANQRYKLLDPRAFALDPESVRATITTDPPPGGGIGAAARLRLAEAQVVWRPDALSPTAQLNLSAGPEGATGAKAALSFDGDRLSAEVVSDAGHDEVAVYIAPPAADSYFALERGALWLPAPPTDAARGAATPRAAFDGLVFARLKGPDGGGQSLTVEAAVAAKVNLAFDLGATTKATSKLKVELSGAYGAIDGTLWAFRGGPSAQEVVPPRDGGPIALRSATLAFGEPPPGPFWKGAMSAVLASAPPALVRLTAPVSQGGWAAVHWAPIRDADRARMPLVAAMNMTRATASATAPSQSRDLIPVAYRGQAADGSLKITLAIQRLGARLPSATIALEKAEAVTGWAAIDPKTERDLPMAALTLPGVEFTANASTKATLRYDLPVLDELFATASPRRPPPPEPQDNLSAQSLAGGIPAPLLEAWHEALRRRDLARTRDDVFWTEAETGPKAAPLAYPYTWAGLKITVDLGASPDLPLGRYRIGDDAVGVQGELALAGLTQRFAVVQENPPTLRQDDNGPLKVTGFALAPYTVTFTAGVHGGESVPTLVDTAGQALATRPDTGVAAWSTRLTRVFPEDDKPIAFRQLLTTEKPIPVALGAADVFLSLRDMPLDVNGESWSFSAEGAPDGAAGPDPRVFDRARLASSLYEWRHYQKPRDGKAPAYAIDVAGLRLRPLRLLSLTADRAAGGCKSAVIVYSAALAQGSAPNALADSPFAADLAYATGNLVAIAFAADGTGGLKADKIGAVARGEKNGELGAPDFDTPPKLTLRVSAKNRYGDGDALVSPENEEPRPIAFGFNLGLTNHEVRPLTDTGFIEATAFGSLWSEQNLAVRVDNNRLRLAPARRDIAGEGLAIRGVGVEISDSAAALLIDAELRLGDSEARAGATAPIRLPLGGELSWYGATLTPENTKLVVDHDRGFMQVEFVAARGALLRGLPEFGAARGFLVTAFDTDHPRPVTQPIALLQAHMEIAARFAGADEDGGVTFRPDEKAIPRLRLQPSSRSRRSAISWPIDAVSDAGAGTALRDALEKTAFAGVERQAELTLTRSDAPVVHEVVVRFEPFELEAKAIAFQPAPKPAVWFLRAPVNTIAHCEHRLTQTPNRSLSFASLDDVALVDLVVLSAQNPLEYAFSPRYRAANKGDDDIHTPRDQVPGAGIVLAPRFGRALREKLKHAKPTEVWPGIAMFGGAVVEWPLKTLALTAALPWLAPLRDNENALKPIDAIAQAPANGAVNVFLTAFDLAGAIPLPFAAAGRLPVVPNAGSLRSVLLAAIAAARPGGKPLDLDARSVADLAFASLPTPAAADAFSVPLYWRTLLALKRLFKDAEGPLEAATVIADTDFGLAHRITLHAADPDPAPQDVPPLLIAIGRAGARTAALPRAPDLGDVDSLRRLAALAESLVKAPIAVYVARPPGPLAPDVAADNFARAPLSLGVPTPRPRDLREWTDALHASPTLGWPRHGGLRDAQTLGLALGDETPLQDQEVAWAGRARRLAGTLLAPEAPAAAYDDARFLAVGRRIAFARAKQDAILTAPADRGLTPVPSRARAPTQGALKAAFAAAGIAPEAPLAGFLPGNYELVATGVRPGVMAFEHEGIVVAGAEGPFDRAFDRFGRPADRMPLVFRQGRAPRSTGLPPTKDPALSRRSFVAQNLSGDKTLQPVALISDAGEAIRYTNREIGVPDSHGDVQLAILVRVTARPGFEDDVQVAFARPTDKTDKEAPSLAATLARLGFLRGGDDGLAAMLTVGAARVDFTQATFTTHEVDAFDRVALTLTKASGRRDIVAAVTAANGATRAVLTLTAGKTIADPVPPGTRIADPVSPLTLTTKRPEGLVPGPPRTLSLRLPLAPLNEPPAPVSVATAIFADAAYDRELASLANAEPSKPGAPKALFAADRSAYELSETAHFAFGQPNDKFLNSKPGGPPEQPFLDFETGSSAWLRVELAPQPVKGVTQPQRELRVSGWARDEGNKAYKFGSPGPFALPLTALQEASGDKATMAPGDRLVLTARRDGAPEDESLVLSCDLIAEPAIAPPAAVYGLVTLDRLAGEGETSTTAATPALFASAPLPSRVEFPDLLGDLVRGHVRRAALYVWNFAPRAAPAGAEGYGGLVKIDRTGGGQIPTDAHEFQPVLKF